MRVQVIKTCIKWLMGRGQGSQFGEDEVLLELFKDTPAGTYLDVGAYHPHLYSNTYALYKRGWRGTAVEPNPAMAPLWRLFRPRDAFVNCAIGPGGEAAYYLHRDAAYNGFAQAPESPLVATRQVPLRPLAEFLKEPVDFVNIDCEGMDVAVLQSHDWAVKPRVIAVEAGEHSAAHRFLLERGYRLYAQRGATLLFVLGS